MADAASPVTTLNYVKASTATTAFLGLPRLCQSPSLSVRQMKALVGIGAATESHPVTLHDARSDSSLRYETCGFKWEPLSSEVVDWSQVAKRGTSEHTLYKAELEAIVRRLHPDAKALAWSTFLLRGGPGENGPAAGAIHLDWYPDVAACKEFLSEHPEGYHDLKDTAAQVKSQPGNENLELKVVLGLWKPRNENNPVKEAPLIEQCFNVNAEGTSVPVANLAANLKYSERQKWYYFKDQTRDEVFVFRHATIEQPSFANFHCGGVLPLPAGMEKRSSVETRVMLYF